jgi:hypothetical protein
MRLPRLRIWVLMVGIAVLAPPLIRVTLRLRESANARRTSANARADYHFERATQATSSAQDYAKVLALAEHCECKTMGDWYLAFEKAIGPIGFSKGGPPDFAQRFDRQKYINDATRMTANLRKYASHHAAMTKKYRRLAERFWERVTPDPATPNFPYPWGRDYPPAVE